MSSLVTQMIVAEKYGVRLNIDQLAEVLGIGKSTLYNQISAGTFTIPTYLDGNKRWADYRDVAAHLDECRQRARQVTL
jgi:predicted DNA-binding transcriptional regulator AlpA